MDVGHARLASELLAGSPGPSGRVDFEAELQAALEASKLEVEQPAQFSAADAEDRALQEALKLSLAGEQAPPPPDFVDDDDEIWKAIKASELEAQKATKREQERRRREDDSDLFQAALRASRVDLGPRGISQAAKIMATGDGSLGQAGAVQKLSSHAGAGGKFERSRSTGVLRASGSTVALASTGGCSSSASSGGGGAARPPSGCGGARMRGTSSSSSSQHAAASSSAPPSSQHAAPSAAPSAASAASAASGASGAGSRSTLRDTGSRMGLGR